MVKEAKIKWMEEECEEAENLLKLHDSFNFHKKMSDYWEL